jgi:hypothetical protein
MLINERWKMTIDLSDLDYRNSPEVIEACIDLILRDIEFDLANLIPPQNYAIAENVARVLLRIEKGRLVPYLADLFYWIEDINWHGAGIIAEVLSLCNFPDIEPYIIKQAEKAVIEKDDVILTGLETLIYYLKKRMIIPTDNKYFRLLLELDYVYDWSKINEALEN